MHGYKLNYSHSACEAIVSSSNGKRTDSELSHNINFFISYYNIGYRTCYSQSDLVERQKFFAKSLERLREASKIPVVSTESNGTKSDLQGPTADCA